MKYIDADRLKAEIERLGRNWDGVQELQPVSLFQADLYELLDIIDSLQQEQPEEPTKGYDEAYLNECIAKASKTWKDVNVDDYMDEVRGREPDNLDEAARHVYESWMGGTMDDVRRDMVELGKVLNTRKEE